MKLSAICFASLLLSSCEEAPDFSGAWKDPETGARFILGEPCEQHYAIWQEIYEAASTLWGEPEIRINVWIAHAPDTMIYCQGEWKSWSGPAMTWRVPGRWAHIYVMATGPDEVTRELMAHECVHALCGVEGHAADFYERYSELTDYINARERGRR